VVACFPLFFLEHGRGQLYPLAAVPDAGTQKQGAQMLFDGAWADIELAGDFLIAASPAALALAHRVA